MLVSNAFLKNRPANSFASGTIGLDDVRRAGSISPCKLHRSKEPPTMVSRAAHPLMIEPDRQQLHIAQDG